MLYKELLKKLIFFFFLFYQLNAQDIRFVGFFQSYTSIHYFNKIEWTCNFSNLFNPINLHFENLFYPASDVRLQIVNLLTYHSGDHWRWGLGYQFQRNFPFDQRHSTEHRPFQQMEFKHLIKKLTITHMLRLNERLVENKSSLTYPLNLSTQYKTSLMFLLKEYSSRQRLSLNGYSEEYFSLSGPIKYQTFSEYWAFVGISYQWAEWGKVEIGLGHEYLIRDNTKEIRSIWYPALNLSSRIHWIKS